MFDRNITETPCPFTGVDPVDAAFVSGDLRVCQPEASRTDFSTPTRRSSLVCFRRNSIGSIPASAAASLIASSRGKFCCSWPGVRMLWSRRPTFSGDASCPICTVPRPSSVTFGIFP